MGATEDAASRRPAPHSDMAVHCVRSSKLDDAIVELEAWDSVRIDKDTMRNLEAGADGAELLLVGAPNSGSGDARMAQGCWTEDS